MSPEDLKSSILKSRSPENWQHIVNLVIENQSLYPYLVRLAFSKESVMGLRASWIMDKISEKSAGIASKDIIQFIIKESPNEPNYSVLRASLRMLCRYEIDINFCGELVNASFEWLSASKTPIAVKVHAMQLLYNFTIQEPDLKNELKIIIEEQMPIGSAGFKARGKHILNLLDKLP